MIPITENNLLRVSVIEYNMSGNCYLKDYHGKYVVDNCALVYFDIGGQQYAILAYSGYTPENNIKIEELLRLLMKTPTKEKNAEESDSKLNVHHIVNLKASGLSVEDIVTLKKSGIL